MPFQTRRRVEFGDTDMAGIMHFSNFFRFMEVAETDFLQSLGLSVAWQQGDEHFGFPRVSAACEYFKPARFGDTLIISVTVEKIGNKSLTHRFDFECNGQVIAVGRITAVFCRKPANAPMESLEIPPAIRTLLQSCSSNLPRDHGTSS